MNKTRKTRTMHQEWRDFPLSSLNNPASMASPRLETLKREVAKTCSSQTLGRSKVQNFIAAVRETHEEWLTQGVETR